MVSFLVTSEKSSNFATSKDKRDDNLRVTTKVIIKVMKTREQINDRYNELVNLFNTVDEMLENNEITNKLHKKYRAMLNQQMNGWRRSAMAYIAKTTGQTLGCVYWRLKGKPNNLLYLGYIVIYK